MMKLFRTTATGAVALLLPIGMLMGPTAEGTHNVVFIMGSPTPQVDSVMIVATDRVQATDIPLTKAFGALSARGLGLGESVKLPVSAT